mmetsp:Transcript_6621/g.16227  ORF Transcript_6621/g.16227 Transcript_6621/m.16227 type:complete len:229 (-) Transcript_6621:44-730(-)
MLSSNSRSFSGRMYLAPAKESRDSDTCEVWINMGTGVQGCQKYPPYIDMLQVACTGEQYAELIMGLQKALQTESIHPGTDVAAQLACALTAGCCFCPCLYLNHHTYKLNTVLGEVVRAKTQSWTCRARLQQTLVTSHVGKADEAIDHRGVPLCIGGGQSIWPPPGYNIIVSVPGSVYRELWTMPGGAHRAVVAPSLCAPSMHAMSGGDQRSQSPPHADMQQLNWMENV